LLKKEVFMRKFAIIPFLTLALACSSSSYDATTSQPQPAMSSAMPAMGQRAMLNEAMRKLWADHVVWTRLYIISAVNGAPDTQAAATRLLANQDQIGQAIVPYYGAAAGQKLASLLRDHILIAVDLVKAAKANDQPAFKAADARWHTNAADLATFLSGANPNWPRQAVLDMLNNHLALTTKEAVDRLQKNYTDDVTNFDAIFNQAMMMADTLSSGIEKQFPQKFTM
jgi:hypothetical protein